MTKNITCNFQQRINLKDYGSSRFFPKELQDSFYLRRLIISAPDGEFEHLLKELSWNDIIWIAFLSAPKRRDNYINEVCAKECKLPLFKKLFWSTGPTASDSHLYYLIGESPEIIKIAIDTELWTDGEGLCIPVLKEDFSEEILKELIQIQLHLGNKLIQAVRSKYMCYIMGRPDKYGVDIVWNESWSYSKQLSNFANKLVFEYPR